MSLSLNKIAWFFEICSRCVSETFLGVHYLVDLNYLEVNVAILVHIECTENMIAEFHGVPRWEEHLVHVNELGRGEPSVGAILLQVKQTNQLNINTYYKKDTVRPLVVETLNRRVCSFSGVRRK